MKYQPPLGTVVCWVHTRRLHRLRKRESEAILALKEHRAWRDRYSEAIQRIQMQHDCSMSNRPTLSIDGRELNCNELYHLSRQSESSVAEANRRLEQVGCQVIRLESKLRASSVRVAL